VVHKGDTFEAQKCSKTHLRARLIKKNISGGYTPGPPLKGGGEKRGEGKEREGAREGRPPIHIPGYATGRR